VTSAVRPSAADDERLAAAASGGDRTALEELLRRHQPKMYAVCRRIVGSDADAADVTQDALIAIVRGITRFDGRASFSTWAYRIATNAALDELRRRRRRAQPSAEVAELGDRSPATSASTPGHDQQVADRMAIDAALATLPDDYRAAVVLRDVADLDYAAIATVLGIPAGTVRSRIARGRAALAAVLGNPAAGSPRPSEQP
jgi:RNA polymerase sigma-70 factor (ECF subfamily)